MDGGGAACGAGDGEGGDEEQLTCIGSSCSKKRMRHINNERQRRVLMNNLLDSLQSLLPDPHARKDRCALLTDVIAHVRTLEEEIQDLGALTAQLKKAKLPANKVTHSAGNNKSSTGLSEPQVTARIRNVHVQLMCPRPPGSGQPPTAAMEPSPSNRTEEVIITFTSSPTRGLLPHVLGLFQKNRIEVINATLSATPDAQMLHFIHARVPKENRLHSDDLKLLFSKMIFHEDNVTYSFTF